jgi:hypothetical protein
VDGRAVPVEEEGPALPAATAGEEGRATTGAIEVATPAATEGIEGLTAAAMADIMAAVEGTLADMEAIAAIITGVIPDTMGGIAVTFPDYLSAAY